MSNLKARKLIMLDLSEAKMSIDHTVNLKEMPTLKLLPCSSEDFHIILLFNPSLDFSVKLEMSLQQELSQTNKLEG